MQDKEKTERFGYPMRYTPQAEKSSHAVFIHYLFMYLFHCCTSTVEKAIERKWDQWLRVWLAAAVISTGSWFHWRWLVADNFGKFHIKTENRR